MFNLHFFIQTNAQLYIKLYNLNASLSHVTTFFLSIFRDVFGKEKHGIV